MQTESVIVTKKDLLRHKAKKSAQSMNKIQKLIETESVLLTVSTAFPFTLFPDKIIITEEKVSLVSQLFFFSKQVRSILIKDIATVQAETSLFFGKLTIIDKNYQALPIIVAFLKRDEALEARRVLQGLIVIARENMELTHVQSDDLTKAVGELGSSREEFPTSEKLDEKK